MEGKCCPLCPCPCNDPSRAGHHSRTSNAPTNSARPAPSRGQQRPGRGPSGYSSSGNETAQSWTHVPNGASSTSHNNSNIRRGSTSSSVTNGTVRETLQVNELLLLKRKLQVLETRLQVLEAQLARLMERHRRLNLLRGNVVTAVNHEFNEFGPV